MRTQTLQEITRHRVSAIIRTSDQQQAADAMNAAVDGGFKLVEFTLTTPGAYELISNFSGRPGLVVGAGTVLTTAQARQAVDAGARFLVSPVVDAEVIAAAHDLDAPIIPGAATPTEMETAHRLGADLIKVFPAPAGGVGFIEAIRGPLPHLKLFPTAGVTADNVIEYLRAGCVGAGFVKTLFDPKDLAERDYVGIYRRAERIVSVAAEFSG